MSIDEAIEYLGVSDRTLRRWVASGRLKYSRTEMGHLRFTAEDLDAALRRRKVWVSA